MDNYLRIFERDEIIAQSVNEIECKMGMKVSTGKAAIKAVFKTLEIAIELKSLIRIWTLGLYNVYPRKSATSQIGSNKQNSVIQLNSVMVNVEFSNVVGYMSDSSDKEFLAMGGSIVTKMRLNPETPDEWILMEAKSAEANSRFRGHSKHELSVFNYSLYFCNGDDLKSKRYIIHPINNVYAVHTRSYQKVGDVCFLKHEVGGSLG
jgi:hypothetical protein